MTRTLWGGEGVAGIDVGTKGRKELLRDRDEVEEREIRRLREGKFSYVIVEFPPLPVVNTVVFLLGLSVRRTTRRSLQVGRRNKFGQAAHAGKGYLGFGRCCGFCV